jgi:hypothetical protein
VTTSFNNKQVHNESNTHEKNPAQTLFHTKYKQPLNKYKYTDSPTTNRSPRPQQNKRNSRNNIKSVGLHFETHHQSATHKTPTLTQNSQVAHFLSEHYLLDNSWGCNSRFFVAVVATATWKRGRRAGGHNCGQCWQQNIREITRVGQGDSVAVVYRNQWIVNTTKISRDRATVLELTKNNT